MSLFRSFQPSKGDVASSTAVKSSVQRNIRTKLLAQYPDTLGKDEGLLLEQIWPKKEPLTLVKFSREHVSILVLNKQPLFFQHFDGPYYPELHLLQKCMVSSSYPSVPFWSASARVPGATRKKTKKKKLTSCVPVHRSIPNAVSASG